MSKEKSKLPNKVSTESYKGVRDFYPEDQAVQNYIFNIMRKAATSFGYKEYAASPLEPSELYQNKTSEEIVSEQTYIFEDRGGRSVTLRPEMTPTVARMVAAKRKALPFPERLFSIPNVFRYERPQRGRLREHYQLNVDLFGIANLDAEIEVISLAHFLMKQFGLKDSQFEIRINDRSILENRFSELGLDDETKKRLYRLLDKKDKIANFDEELSKIVGSDVNLDIQASKEVLSLIKNLKKRGISNAVFKSDFVRGFDYYSGIIFEIFDTNPQNNRSLFGGGRYDNLLEIFEAEPVPAVGFGMGDVTIRDTLETYDLLPESFSYTDVYVCVLDQESKLYADQVALKLRESGIRTTADLRYDSISSQIKRAVSMDSAFAVIIGGREVETGRLQLKNLKTETQDELNIEQIIMRCKDKLNQ